MRRPWLFTSLALSSADFSSRTAADNQKPFLNRRQQDKAHFPVGSHQIGPPKRPFSTPVIDSELDPDVPVPTCLYLSPAHAYHSGRGDIRWRSFPNGSKGDSGYLP